MLTKLAADGFERLAEAMDPARVKNANDNLEASGLGYIQFAMKWPEHFRVMWHSELLDQQSPRLRLARERGLRILRDALIHANEHWATPLSEDELAARFEAAWCCVHGYASLWVEGSRNHGHSTKHDACSACCGHHLCESRPLFLKRTEGRGCKVGNSRTLAAEQLRRVHNRQITHRHQ